MSAYWRDPIQLAVFEGESMNTAPFMGGWALLGYKIMTRFVGISSQTESVRAVLFRNNCLLQMHPRANFTSVRLRNGRFVPIAEHANAGVQVLTHFLLHFYPVIL